MNSVSYSPGNWFKVSSVGVLSMAVSSVLVDKEKARKTPNGSYRLKSKTEGAVFPDYVA